MKPGESPLDFFLRTQASAEVRDLAEDAKAAESKKKDAFWAQPGSSRRVAFLHEGVQVQAIPGRGRGLRTSVALKAGAVVLREMPLAATLIEAADQPMAPVARLAGALLVHGLEPTTRNLEPRPGHAYLSHPARGPWAAELSRGWKVLCEVAKGTPLSDEDGERLLLTIMLNSLGIAQGGCRFQALFSEIGAMANHSCRPNMLFRGAGGSGDDLALVFRAARDIELGEELTISYLEELYLPFPEREDRLQQLHCISPDSLPTDGSLVAMSSSLSPEQRQQATQRVMAANSAASDAWEQLSQLLGGDNEKELKRLRALCISAYVVVLNANLLAETHSWRYNATWRLAMLLTQDGTPEACRKALPLWDSALRCGLRVWPSEMWPEHRPLLRGAKRAAELAKDAERMATYQAQLERIEALLD